MDRQETIERALKAVVNWNKQVVPFDDGFLKLQDFYDLVIEVEKDGLILFKTQLKQDQKKEKK